MEKIETRRKVLRWTVLAAAAATLSACHGRLHAPGQIKKQFTPAATGTAPGQAKKKK